MPRRVVVTGVGLISPLGVGTEATWEALIAGKSGVGPITRFDASSFPVRIAGEAKGFDPQQWMDAKEARKFDLFVQYALAASLMAVENAGLAITPEIAERVAVVLGSGIGGLPLIEENHRTLQEKGPRRVSPFFIPGAIINMCSGLVSIRLGAKGPNMATCTACSTSAHAITDAYLYIRHGYADAAIAGGAEAVIDPLAVAGFASMRALSTRNEEPEKASRPWDRDRDGFVMGEGAGVLVLEELEFATRRGAPILCEVLGIGMTGDAYHITAPCEDGDGAARVMALALKDAGIAPEQVDYINAHGTSTQANDAVETLAIKRLFGDHAYRIPVSSTKSMMGHSMGAAGAIEAAVCALTLSRGQIHPTINYEFPDPECDLDYVPNTWRKADVRVALSNSFGLGGQNACLVLQRVED